MKTFSMQHPEKGEIAYTDRKRYLWISALFFPLVALSGIGLYSWSGSEWSFVVPLVLFYGGIPLFDWLLGEDTSNPPEELVAQLEADAYYRWLPMLTVPMHFAVLIIVAGSPVPMTLSLARTARAGADGRALQRHRRSTRRTSSATRSRMLERWIARIVLGRARVRPLLRRAQPRASSQCGHAGRSGQLADGREHLQFACARFPAPSVAAGTRSGASRAPGQVRVAHRERDPAVLCADRRAAGRGWSSRSAG